MTANLFINDILCLDNELAINWNDGSQSYLMLRILRDKCPCAFCSGEKDVLGNVYKGPEQKLQEIAYEMKKFEKVGHYAIRIFWGDNHADGLYTYEYLRNLGEIDENKT